MHNISDIYLWYLWLSSSFLFKPYVGVPKCTSCHKDIKALYWWLRGHFVLRLCIYVILILICCDSSTLYVSYSSSIIYIYIYMCVFLYVYIFVYIYMYIYKYVCVYVCVCAISYLPALQPVSGFWQGNKLTNVMFNTVFCSIFDGKGTLWTFLIVWQLLNPLGYPPCLCRCYWINVECQKLLSWHKSMCFIM